MAHSLKTRYIFCHFTGYCKIKKEEITVACSTHADDEVRLKMFVGKPEYGYLWV
jgi:hypothetical protein